MMGLACSLHVAKEMYTFFIAKPLRKCPVQIYERLVDNIKLNVRKIK
jgi:hypothetical protein